MRWNDIGDDWASMFAPQFGSVLLIQRFFCGWSPHSFIRGQSRHSRPTYTRRCDAKRAAEVLVGQWWREKCGREAKAADYKARVLSAFRGENHGAGTVDVVARAIAERVNAAQKSFDETMARSDFMRCPEGADLDRLATLYGVERRASAEETRAACADALRNAVGE